MWYSIDFNEERALQLLSRLKAKFATEMMEAKDKVNSGMEVKAENIPSFQLFSNLMEDYTSEKLDYNLLTFDSYNTGHMTLFLGALNKKQTYSLVRKSEAAGSIMAIKFYLDFIALLKVETSLTQVSGSPMNFGSMALSLQGYSATLYNPTIFPRQFNRCSGFNCENIVFDKGTNGQVTDALLTKSSKVTILPNGNEKLSAEEFLSSYFSQNGISADNSKIRTIIDIGAYFKRFTNEQVARSILEFFSDKNQTIQGVL